MARLRLIQNLKYLLAPLLLSLSLFIIFVPLNMRSQFIFAGVTVVGTLMLRRWKSSHTLVAINIVSILVSTRYILWRTTQTLGFSNLTELLLGSALYGAELYAWIILVLGATQTIWPLKRPVKPLAGEPTDWPTVDIYVPTYNESLQIVANTVFAAMDQDYPADRFRVFILDDGRRPQFRAFAQKAGCGYITRHDNAHAKAGNLNAAMGKTYGEFIAVFDCDHVPTRAFLQLTMGWLQADRDLALLQTPHHMYSLDPVQRNLSQLTDMPGEGDLFYGPVQEGNDLWNATFFCGSCAVMRRAALEEIGGFARETVTEDAHTALRLQRQGWKTAFLGLRLSAGLATERLALHVGQRIRWARGMMQIMRIDFPLLGPGLSVQQRFCYLNAMLHFMFPLPRIVFLTSPLAYLILGQNIIQASALMILAYALPHLACSMLVSDHVDGGARRPFWSEIYETILAFHLAPVTVMTLINPRKGKFNVTEKGSIVGQDYFDWRVVRPHLICIALLLTGVALALAKQFYSPYLFNIQIDTLVINLVWALFSVAILLVAVATAWERRQSSPFVQMPRRFAVSVNFSSGHVVDGETEMISVGDARLALPRMPEFSDAEISHITLSFGEDALTLPVETVSMADGHATVRYLDLTMAEQRLLTRLLMGRADAWECEDRPSRVHAIASIKDILRVSLAITGRLLKLEFVRLSRAGRKPSRKAPAMATAALLLAAALGVAPARPVQAASLAPAAFPPSGTLHQHFTLKDMLVRQPIRLQGTRGEVGLPFGVHKDMVVSGATLTLALAWSPQMLDDLSQLVVMVNGEVAQTIPLHRVDSGGIQVSMPINPAFFLPGRNQLNLRLVGHYTRDCEDPFHSALWANVSHVRSSLDLTLQSVAMAPSLSTLPMPFFERSDVLPLKVPFVFAARPGPGQLEAAAATASWLGSLASYRGFSFKPVYGQFPAGNAVVFLRAGESLPGLAPAIAGPSAMMMTNPVDPYGTLLVIMGRNDAELAQAAGVVATGRGILSGALMNFSDVRLPAYAAYEAPRWLSTAKPIRLGEIMEASELTGMGIPPGPLTGRFRLAPDLFFWPHVGGRLNLMYNYPTAPWLDRSRSRLDVMLNGQFLTAVPLNGGNWWHQIINGKLPGGNPSRVRLDLPGYALFGRNDLTFDYNLLLADKQKCSGTLPDNVRVSINPNSTIDLTDAWHATLMPNLATFASAGYPFTVMPDLSRTVVVVPENPEPGTVEAFLVMMGRFGDSTGAAATGVAVVTQVVPEKIKDSDVLVIGGSAMAGMEKLFANSPVKFSGGALQVRQNSPLDYIEAMFAGVRTDAPADTDAAVYGAKGFSGIVSFRSPFGDAHTVVALIADNQADLPTLVDGMADNKINAAIKGDLSVTTGDSMSSYKLGQVYWVGNLPIWLRISYWISLHPVLMAFSVLITAIFFSAPVTLFLRRRAHKRLHETEAPPQ